MKYRRLGRTGLRVSVVGIGTWQLGGEWGQSFTQREVDRLLGRAGESGVILVDTAECYGDHLAEELIGAAIRQRRDDWVIATKFGHRFHPEAMGQEQWSPGSVRSDHWTPQEVIGQLEASLRALGTDHVDLYQAHSAPLMQSSRTTTSGRPSTSRWPRAGSGTWACRSPGVTSTRPGGLASSARP
jgi:aryl-alcohol dehydrogenase-like predicted oxidoreductase